LLCTAVHYQEGKKINVNKRGHFLKFSSVEKICLQYGNRFPRQTPTPNCCLLCDSPVLIINAKI